MKFPYGVCDFYQITTEDYFYVDRSDRIPLIEEMGNQLLFMRPRRFGKTLLLSMLENYYDVAKADEFERLFGHLAIGRAPTPRHNQYFVMKWDFSMVDSQGEPHVVKQALHNHINNQIKFFASYYRAWLSQPIEIDPADAVSSFESLLAATRQSPHNLYLLVDEYDNFANEVALNVQGGSPGRYEALLYGEGALKTIFKAVKGGSAGRGLERVFITGVSPIVLSDITSGYNVARNIYLLPAVQDLCGFTEAEIAAALDAVAAACHFAPDRAVEALDMMRTFYNGYRFTYDAEQPVYNPTLALYFLQEFQERCRYPEQMLDSNLAMDRSRLAYVARLPDGPQLILDAVNGEPPVSVMQLADRFGLADMLREDQDAAFTASLLYYLGVLTLDGRTPLDRLILRIPNLVIRQLYVERLREILLPNRREWAAPARAVETFFQNGDLGPLCDFVEQRYFRALDNRDYRGADEQMVKTVFLTLLFNDHLYITDSEAELERGYADLTMIVRPEHRHLPIADFLFEFKYVALAEAKLTGEQARALSGADARNLAPVQAQLAAARAQLQRYRATLQARYGARLRLRSYAVVSLGFDRLVWEEV
jgi:hypothetical protein